MMHANRNILTATSLLLALLLVSGPAHAFRCGSKLVLEGMLEQEVVNHCGEPTAIRHLGFVVRAFSPLSDTLPGRQVWSYGGNYYYHEVPVTVYVYNFGPRKLMRQLRFEDGFLTDIQTLGYGYLENDDETS